MADDTPDWADDNPFASPPEASPFNDPSVAQAQGSSTMPEYDPFSNGGDASGGSAPAAAPAAPVSTEPTPDWATQDSSAVKGQHFGTKDEAVRAKDYEQAERQAQQDTTRQQGPKQGRPANWPPFPEKCVWPLKPCFHHDFRGELPAYGYSVAKHGYYVWCAYFFGLFWNFVCGCIALSAGIDNSSVLLGLAFAYLFIFGPMAYMCWFQSLYKAIMKDGSSNLTWGWFFFTYLFQWIFCCIMVIGVPSTGGVGWMTAIMVNKEDTGGGIVCFTAAIWWTLLTFYITYHMKWALKVFKMAGGSFEGAQKEAQQVAAAGAVAAAVAK